MTVGPGAPGAPGHFDDDRQDFCESVPSCVGVWALTGNVDDARSVVIKMSRPSYTDDRPTAVFDTETFANYWSIKFKCVQTGKRRLFELYNDEGLDRVGIANVIRTYRIVGFNSQQYDIPMIALAMTGADNATLKRASDLIILSDMKPWNFFERFDCGVPNFLDHIDLMQVSPGAPTMPSLKLYGGRLHSRKMQDLPVEPDEWITEDTLQIIRSYHDNDLDVTQDLYTELKAQLDLRAFMSVEYGVDLRSKSDAQMAEAIVKSQLERRLGRRISYPELEHLVFNFRIPPYISFHGIELRRLLEDIRTTHFVVTHSGIVEMPESLADREVRIGDSVYRLGLGGLHSSEKSVFYESNDDVRLYDSDVASYYPYLILGAGLVPKHLGQDFLAVYKQIVERRIKAKKEGKKDIAESLKITANGVFGKLGSPYSIMYAPDLMIQVTLSGQLAILMLIEQLERAGIKVVSANTDGFVSLVPNELYATFFDLKLQWETLTGLITEEKAYKGLYSRDVNNYIAIPVKGKVKTKGAYGEAGPGQPGAAGLKKNPAGEIAVQAVIALLKDGTPIEQTIEDCWDVRPFLCVRRVKGGAEKEDEYVGKAIRWYYSTTEQGPITYRLTGNNVPETEGAKPLMELTGELPRDLDHEWYIREAYGILQEIGYSRIDPKLRGRSGVVMARLPDQKNIHLLQLETGVSLCGVSTKSVRKSWIEYRERPDGHRFCAACKRGEL